MRNLATFAIALTLLGGSAAFAQTGTLGDQSAPNRYPQGTSASPVGTPESTQGGVSSSTPVTGDQAVPNRYPQGTSEAQNGSDSARNKKAEGADPSPTLGDQAVPNRYPQSGG